MSDGGGACVELAVQERPLLVKCCVHREFEWVGRGVGVGGFEGLLVRVLRWLTARAGNKSEGYL